MKRAVVAILLLILWSADLQAATIFQNWDIDNWLRRIDSGCGTTYTLSSGYLYSQARRKNGADTVGEIYTPLGTNAIAAGTAAASVPEFWLGLDFQFPSQSGTTSYQCIFGILNSQSDNITSSTNRNWIGVTLGGQSVIAQAQQNTSGGTALTVQLAAVAGAATNDTYRIKMHVYSQGGSTVTDVSVYQWIASTSHWNLAGSISGTLGSGTNIFSSGMDAFGLRNSYNSSSYTGTAPAYNMDNMYFSTNGPMPDTVYPSWISLPIWPAAVSIPGICPEIKPGLSQVNTPIQHQTYFQQERELFGYNPRYTPSPVAFGQDDHFYFKGNSEIETVDYNGVYLKYDCASVIRSYYPSWNGAFANCSETRLYIDNYNCIYAIVNPVGIGYSLMYSTDLCRTWRIYSIPGSPLDVTMECRDTSNDTSGPPTLLTRYMLNSVNTLGLVVVTKDSTNNLTLAAPKQVSATAVIGTGFKIGGNLLATRNNKTHIVFSGSAPNGSGTPAYGVTYDRTAGTMSSAVFLGNAGTGNPDANSWPCVCVDKNGFVHVLLNPYIGSSGNYCKYIKSSQADTVSSGWTTAENLPSGLVRASMVCDPNITLHVVAADTADIQKSLKYTYKRSGQSWSTPAVLVKPWNDTPAQAAPETFYNPILSIDERNRLFVSYSTKRTLSTPAQQLAYQAYNPCGTGIESPAVVTTQDHTRTWQLATTDKFVYAPYAVDTALTDSQFFSVLNLDYNGLSAVKSAVQSANYPKARAEFAKYLRQRTGSYWYWDPHVKTPSSGSASDLSYAYDFANHTGIYNNNYWLANGEYDWFNGDNIATNYPRMYFLTNIGDAYWYSGTEYPAVTDYVNIMRSWIRQVPKSADPGGIYWETLNTGIRLRSGWGDAFNYCLTSPVFDNNTMTIVVKSFVEQARNLRTNYSAKANNWLTFEMAGLFSAGVLFPELTEASDWRSFAAQTALDDMTQGWLPDGGGIELSTNYGQFFYNFYTIANLAAAVGRTSEFDIVDLIPLTETPLDYYVRIMTPDGMSPPYNDGGQLNVKSFMSSYYNYFPSRNDFKWVGTSGSQGSPPTYTSCFLPYSGYAAMRDGWNTNNNYLGFDPGPPGLDHAHMDKLQIVMWSYGRYILFDTERDDYSNTPISNYAADTFSHSTVLVDNRPQRRNWGTPNTGQIPYQPLTSITWETDAAHDLAGASYSPPGSSDERYGMVNNNSLNSYPYQSGGNFSSGWVNPATHYRRVYFLKDAADPVFVVCDTMVAKDSSSHTYDCRWQINSTSTATRNTNWVDTTDAGTANLEIVPLITSGLTINKASAQQSSGTSTPLLGWRDTASTPATTLQYKRSGTGTVQFITLLVPLRSGVSSLVSTVSGSSPNWTVTLSDGRTIHVTCDTNPAGTFTVSF